MKSLVTKNGTHHQRIDPRVGDDEFSTTPFLCTGSYFVVELIVNDNGTFGKGEF